MSRATPSASGPQWGWPRGIRWDRAHAAAHSPPRTEPHLICCREELVSQVPGAASEAQTGPKSPNVGTVPPNTAIQAPAGQGLTDRAQLEPPCAAHVGAAEGPSCKEPAGSPGPGRRVDS